MTDYEIDSLWMRRTNIHNGELMPQLRDFARAVIKEAVAKERDLWSSAVAKHCSMEIVQSISNELRNANENRTPT